MYHILRVGAAMCFIGHGAFGIITKTIWCNYFAVFGIGHDMAYRLMPALGTADILFGISLLAYPMRAVALWLVIWGLITAALRPLSGEPFAELLERAGNYGVPAALLFLTGGFYQAKVGMLKQMKPPTAVDPEGFKWVFGALRVSVFLLLLGHGWLNLIEKPGLLSQYASLGFPQPQMVAHAVGAFEVLAATALLLFPNRPLLVTILVWKMGSELLYPHYELFEWIERGGSYAAILSLWYCLKVKGVSERADALSDQVGVPGRA